MPGVGAIGASTRAVGSTIKALPLVKRGGVWKWAVNGRKASIATLKRYGLLKPTHGTVIGRGKPFVGKEFVKTASGVPNPITPLSNWGKVKLVIANLGQLFQ